MARMFLLKTLLEEAYALDKIYEQTNEIKLFRLARDQKIARDLKIARDQKIARDIKIARDQKKARDIKIARDQQIATNLKIARDKKVTRVKKAKQVTRTRKVTRDQRVTRDEDYVRIYRLNKELIDELEIELNPLVKTTKRRGKGLTIRIKILCTLSFLANGTHQKIIQNNVRTHLSQPSASRCISEVVEALNNPSIVHKYIRFPQNMEERQILKDKFYEKFKIPGVIGCIDGTLVAMKRPVEDEERFFCCKGYYARNVQLITDADLNILHVDPTHGGDTQDSFIFNYCVIRDHLEALTNAGEEVALLGDSGYPQQAYVMTPIKNAEENTPEALYNSLHSTAFNAVEQTIDLLKGRFRCLLVDKVLKYHPDKVAKIAIACCVLHNICNRAGLPTFTMSAAEKLEEAQIIARTQIRQTVDLPSQAVLDFGLLQRQNLVNRLWSSRDIAL